MARENQGLQIAVIIFFLLSFILGVTTFIFFKQAEEAEAKAKKNLNDYSVEKLAAKNMAADKERLAELIGFKPNEDVNVIEKQHDDDMRSIAGAYENVDLYYRPVMVYQYNELKSRATELADAKVEIQSWKDKYDGREREKDAQIQQFEVAAKNAGSEAARERQKFDGDRQRITAEQAKIQELLKAARTEAATRLAVLETNLQESGERVAELEELNEQKATQLEEFETDTFDVPDGEIRWVNQRNGTVWISLGSADRLGLQTTFSVYPADISDLSTGGSKGSIEVTQILGQHSAQARIVESRIADPIVLGDKIHTPIWSPGEQKRFALTGIIDVEDDGKSDLRMVRNLITMSGGIVDAWIDDNGERHGQITPRTRYLVEGQRPDESTAPKVRDSNTWMQDQAKKAGVKRISLQELLDRMGWKRQSGTVRLGRGADPNDFRATPAGGVPRVSTGNVSDVFKSRRPPTRTSSDRGSAY